MPSLTVPASPQVVDLADRLAAKLNSGSASRETITDHEVAFGWAAGLPSILAGYVSASTLDGLSFSAVRVAASQTPAAKVAEGGKKPTATVLTTVEVRLAKYAGLSIFSTEQALTTVALLPALYSSLVQQALVAFDRDAVAQLAADHGAEKSAASWTGAILAGLAEVIAHGGNPDLVVLSGADYAAVVESPGSAFTLSPIDAVPSLFGLRVAVCVGALPGTGYVLDSKGVICVENANSPAVVLDPYSSLDTNAVRMAAELFAATVVATPSNVCEISVTGGTVGAETAQANGRQSEYALGA